MSAYIIGLIEIHDRDEYNKYQAGFREIFSKYGGEILVVEETPTLLEGEWPHTRTVVIRLSAVSIPGITRQHHLGKGA